MRIRAETKRLAAAVVLISLTAGPPLLGQTGMGEHVVQGRVVDENGAPAPGVRVLAVYSRAPYTRRETETDANGRWRIPSLTKRIDVWSFQALSADRMSYPAEVMIRKPTTEITLTLALSAQLPFVEAKKSVQDGDFEKAVERLAWFLEHFPGHRDGSAARFWLAYSLNAQGEREADLQAKKRIKSEAGGILDELILADPDSDWIDDARILRIDTALFLARHGEASALAVILKEAEASGPAEVDIRLTALDALSRLVPGRALEEMKAIIRGSPDPLIRRKAVMLVGRWTDDSLPDFLREIAAKDPDAGVREAARIALTARNARSSSRHSSPR